MLVLIRVDIVTPRPEGKGTRQRGELRTQPRQSMGDSVRFRNSKLSGSGEAEQRSGRWEALMSVKVVGTPGALVCGRVEPGS